MIFELFYELIGVLIGSAIVWAIIMFIGWLGDIEIGKKHPYRNPHQPHCRRNPAPGWKR